LQLGPALTERIGEIAATGCTRRVGNAMLTGGSAGWITIVG